MKLLNLSTFVLVKTLLLISSEGFVHAFTTQHQYLFMDENHKLHKSGDDIRDGVKWTAQASFTDKTEEEGFSYLTIETNSNLDDATQAYSAGYLEGYLTSTKINQTFHNTGAGTWGFNDEVKNFIAENYQFLTTNVDSKQDQTYWYHVGLIMNQIKGIEDAYLGKPPVTSRDIDPAGPLWEFHWQMGELSDLTTKFKAGKIKVNSFSCSALVRNLGYDIIASHDTWGDYIMMLRIIKKFILPFKSTKSSTAIIPGTTILESSYPGIVNSVDDYYQTSQSLAVFETTNGIQNTTLYDFIVPDTVPYFLRVTVANRLSTSGKDWVDYFAKFNSGTYNNQWMIVDYKQFTPNETIQPGTLYVLEQLPGFIMSKDMSNSLMTSEKAWVSYNVPYFPETQAINNYTAYINAYGLFYSHDHCPRANIFRRDLPKAVDLNSTIALMRYNDFQNDPYAACNCTPLGYSGENGISARCELNPLNGTYQIASEGARCHGATDMKMTNSEMIEKMQMIAISGPTHDQQPIFDWTRQDNTACKGHNPQGHPKRFDFGPVLVDI